ncbi:autotransporter outer membrane beta-barrel domain-containing protein [Neisseriaceae bacterium ESL0693]|nr:autotransporter outer membrane beta-barrel domain-containing protein [Neisseriaceae bacterium ESL0693]
MNKIYRIIWSSVSGSWTVASELTKSNKKSGTCLSKAGVIGSILLFSGFSAVVYADECKVRQSTGLWSVAAGTTCEITGQSKQFTLGLNDKGLGLTNSTVNVIGDGNLDIDGRIFSVNNFQRYLSKGIDLYNSSLTANDLHVNLFSDDPGKAASVMGIRVSTGANLAARDVTSTVVYTGESTNNNSYNASYGGNPSGLSYAMGMASSKGATTKTTQATVHDATLSITNTPATNIGADNAVTDQLVGLYVAGDDTSTKANAVFTSTGKVTVNAYDSSVPSSQSKGDPDYRADYIVGIAVSGAGSKINLHDSDVTLGKSGQYSSALKIGRLQETSSSGGDIASDGHMVLNSTAESTAPTVRLVADNSKLIADYDGSSSDIQSGSTAILFGNEDHFIKNVSTKPKEEALMNLITIRKEAKDQEVRLKDAKVTTTANDASLFVTQAGVTNAQLTITGAGSEVKAADNGWLTEVEDPSKWDGKQASMTFNLDNKAVAEGQMTTSGTSTLDVNVTNDAVWRLKPKGDLSEQASNLTNLNLSSGGVLDASAYSTSAGVADYTIKVPQFNNDGGVIMLSTGKYKNTLTIDGDYAGSNGAAVQVNAFDTQGAPADPAVLHITGSATGQTVIHAQDASNLNGDINENKNKLNSALTIQIDQDSPADVFIGDAATTGAGLAQLTSTVDENGKQVYYWTLNTKPDNGSTDGSGSIDGSGATNGSGSAHGSSGHHGGGHGGGKDIYAAPVAGYVVMPRVNAEQNYAAIATLQQRRAEGSNTPDWVRTFGQHLAQDGKTRLNMNSDIYGFQFGHDFRDEVSDQGNRSVTGAYVVYSHADTDFSDRYRAVNAQVVADKYTGKGKSDLAGIGITNTWYMANGSYVDVLGQVSYLHDKYEGRDGSRKSQNGWSGALSAEAGHGFGIGSLGNSNWILEPQAQLIYQYVNLHHFNDGIRQVDQNNQQALRGRVGARLAMNRSHDQNLPQSFYLLANVWHDFINPNGVDIGADRIKERYSRSWGELGLGTQIPVMKNGAVYGDGGYQHDFGSTKRHGWRGNLGFKLSW